jgi:NAD+ synthase
VPEFGPGWGCKVVIANALKATGFYNMSYLVVQSPEGESRQAAHAGRNLSQAVVAATNMKQRTRKQLEYYHADRLNYAVIGTPNRLEYDQGFFVKNGDGAADLKPIAHLYKTQVYQLARPSRRARDHPFAPADHRHLVARRRSQEEFYFSVPYAEMDLCMYGLNNGIAAEEVGRAAGLTAEQVGRVWTDIASKRKTTRYLHSGPLLVDPVPEI